MLIIFFSNSFRGILLTLGMLTVCLIFPVKPRTLVGAIFLKFLAGNFTSITDDPILMGILLSCVIDFS